MVAPSLSFVSGLFVVYLVARFIDRRGRGGIFLPVMVLCFLHGEQAVVPSLMAVVVLGALLSLFEAASEGLDEKK